MEVTKRYKKYQNEIYQMLIRIKTYVEENKPNYSNEPPYIQQTIKYIVQNYNLLRISGFLNDDLENLIRDLEIEFRTLYGTLVDESGEKLFWDSLDAINKDLEKYIGTWKDIEYYNNILFEAGKFF